MNHSEKLMHPQKFRLEVGTQAMETLLHVLETDRADSEITGYALDALCNVMSNDIMDDGESLLNAVQLFKLN